MKNRVTLSRTKKRTKPTRAELKKENNVVEFWKKRLEVYQNMTIEELLAIKNTKRSLTDNHAYECALLAKEKESK